MDETPDLAFVQKVMAGDRSAIDEFAQRMRCVPRLLTWQNRRFGRPLDDHDLADLAQDIAMIVWRKLGEYRGLGVLEAWIGKVCSLEFRNALRSSRRRPRHFPDGDADDIEAVVESGFADAERVRTALLRLDGSVAEIIRAHHFEGLNFVELARREGLPLNTVKTRYYRGLKSLEWMFRTTSSERTDKAENKKLR